MGDHLRILSGAVVKILFLAELRAELGSLVSYAGGIARSYSVQIPHPQMHRGHLADITAGRGDASRPTKAAVMILSYHHPYSLPKV